MYLSRPVSFSSSIRSYIHKSPCSQLLIISPFITLDALGYLLYGLDAEVKVSIITNWKVESILYGSLDIRVYEYCKAHKYSLYHNERIHLKAICKDFETCIFGSANIMRSVLARGMMCLHYLSDMLPQKPDLKVEISDFSKKPKALRL
ncbi:MAG TPA: hypothetical protein O0X23_02440 [Methanocorpusculum sp.]|nr:hypothetical protein [Methanocorpusculum sp.]